MDIYAAAASSSKWASLPQATKTGDYTVVAADAGSIVIANKATAIAFTLPAASAGLGPYFFRNIGAGLLTVGRAGSDTIEGGTSRLVYTGHDLILYSDGVSAWRGMLIPASGTEFVANSPVGRLLTNDRVWAAAALVSLTDAATIAVDMSTFINATVTLGDNRTLGNPTNTKNGQSFILFVIEDGTGTRTLAFASNYKFPAGTPSIDTGANKVNVFTGFVKSSTEIVMNYWGSY